MGGWAVALPPSWPDQLGALQPLPLASWSFGSDDDAPPGAGAQVRGRAAIARLGGGGTHFLLALVIGPLTTPPFRDGAPFPLLVEAPPTRGALIGDGGGAWMKPGIVGTAEGPITFHASDRSDRSSTHHLQIDHTRCRV